VIKNGMNPLEEGVRSISLILGPGLLADVLDHLLCCFDCVLADLVLVGVAPQILDVPLEEALDLLPSWECFLLVVK
jgi:hypothetical protein